MFTRRADIESGEYIREVLEPMAEQLGMSYQSAFVTRPRTDPALAFETYRCALSLMMAFTRPDGWGTTGPYGTAGRAKPARKAAKRMRQALREPQGRAAISHMAQRYALETAASWRRAAESDYGGHAARLLDNAARSEALGGLAGKHWPVEDPLGLLARMSGLEQKRFFRLDNPDQMIDMQTAVGRIEAACESAALALSSDFETFSELLLGPILTFNLELAAGIQRDWTFQLDHWTNLMSKEPLSFHEVLLLSHGNEGHTAG